MIKRYEIIDLKTGNTIIEMIGDGIFLFSLSMSAWLTDKNDSMYYNYYGIISEYKEK